jgi:uncharacterized membrane protein
VSVKTFATTTVVIATSVLGNLFLTLGMRRVGDVHAPADFLRAFTEPLVIAGVVLLLGWMLSHMALLSWADLSFVLPVTSIGYVLAALAGWVFLNEQISAARWTGVGLIVAGVAIVGRTPPRTTT